jgi:hypothetical protein
MVTMACLRGEKDSSDEYTLNAYVSIMAKITIGW